MDTMSEVANQDGLQTFHVPVHMPERNPDPQAIQEDPEVARDRLIILLRRVIGSGKAPNHLLKGREY